MKKVISIVLVSAIILAINIAVSGISFNATKYEFDKATCEVIFKVKPEKAENAVKYSEWIENNFISVKATKNKVTLVLSEKNVKFLKDRIQKMVNQKTIANNHEGFKFDLNDSATTLTYETLPELQPNNIEDLQNNLPYILFLQMLKKGNAQNLKLKVNVINLDNGKKVKTATLPNGDLSVEKWS